MKRRHLTLAALAGAAVGYAYVAHGHRCPRCGEDEIHLSLTCLDNYDVLCGDCDDGGGGDDQPPGGQSRRPVHRRDFSGISRRSRHRTPYNRPTRHPTWSVVDAQADGQREADDVPTVRSLRESSSDFGSGHVDLTLDQLRTARRRDPSFPQPWAAASSGLGELFDAEDLNRWKQATDGQREAVE